MEAISLLKELVDDTPKKISVVLSRCLRNRLNTSTCDLCLDVCPAEGIYLKGRKVKVDLTKCSNCMLCTAVCPNDVFAFSCDVEKMIAMPEQADQIVFSCERQELFHPDERVVPCLAAISWQILICLGSVDTPSIFFNIEKCEECENALAVSKFLTSLEHFQEVVGSLLSTTFILVKKSDTALQAEVNHRRTYLSSLKKQLFTAANNHISKRSPEREKTNPTNRRIPAKTKIIDSLINRTEKKLGQALIELTTPRLRIDKECNLCPKCAGICPTGALKMQKTEQKKRLLFNRNICSGCGLCVSFCKQKALSLRQPPLNNKKSCGK